MATAIYSTLIDSSAEEIYSAYYLVLSLIHLSVPSSSIIVHLLPDVPELTEKVFQKLGCTTVRLALPDNKSYSKKLSQLRGLVEGGSDYIILLEPQMLVVEPLDVYFNSDLIQAKVADYPKPSLAVFKSLATTFGLDALPASIASDYSIGDTFIGNANSALYIIPRALAKNLVEHWSSYFNQLIAHHSTYLDEISFFFAIHLNHIPFRYLPSNANYSLQANKVNIHLDARDNIRALNHRSSLNRVGLFEIKTPSTQKLATAMVRANQVIQKHFHNQLFWNFRYEQNPELGSGVGSRGETANYKRDLMREIGIESAESVLDYGCGDLEVIKPLKIRSYLGLDQSDIAIQKARESHPNWQFRLFSDGDSGENIPEAEIVLCMEVLIHQKTEESYRRIIEIISSKCKKTLMVSGYETLSESYLANHMLGFYEPLSQSLQKTDRFSKITCIGCHSDIVYVFRCDRK